MNSTLRPAMPDSSRCRSPSPSAVQLLGGHGHGAGPPADDLDAMAAGCLQQGGAGEADVEVAAPSEVEREVLAVALARRRAPAQHRDRVAVAGRPEASVEPGAELPVLVVVDESPGHETPPSHRDGVDDRRAGSQPDVDVELDAAQRRPPCMVQRRADRLQTGHPSQVAEAVGVGERVLGLSHVEGATGPPRAADGAVEDAHAGGRLTPWQGSGDRDDRVLEVAFHHVQAGVEGVGGVAHDGHEAGDVEAEVRPLPAAVPPALPLDPPRSPWFRRAASSTSTAAATTWAGWASGSARRRGGRRGRRTRRRTRRARRGAPGAPCRTGRGGRRARPAPPRPRWRRGGPSRAGR